MKKLWLRSILPALLLVGVVQAANFGGKIAQMMRGSVAPNTPVLEKLPAGTTVAIYSVSAKKYLRLESSEGSECKFLKATGESKDDLRCQFQILRTSKSPNWVGFKSLLHNGYSLQSDAGDNNQRICRFENANFMDAGHTWEQWGLVPNSENSLDLISLYNRATTGFLTVHDFRTFNGRCSTNRSPNNLKVQGKGSFLDFSSLFKIEIVKALEDKDHPGGSEFTFRRSMRDGMGLVFSRKWKFKDSTRGVVKFKALAPMDVYVGFSPDPAWANERTFWFAIGGWSNTQTVLFSNFNVLASKVLRELNPNKVLATEADMVKGGWGFNGADHHNFLRKTDEVNWEETGNYKGNEWGDYWASFEIVDGKVKFSYGTGTTTGQNIRMTHEVNNPSIRSLGYLGLGGYYLDVEFKDIQIDPEKTEDEYTISTVPGFEKIEGLAQRVSIGGQRVGPKDKGYKYLAMMVGRADGKLYKMDSTTMGGWAPLNIKIEDKVQNLKFVDVCVAADGAVGVVAETGEIFVSFNAGNEWKSLGMPLDDEDKKVVVDRIAVPSRGFFAVLDKQTGDVFKYAHDHKAKDSKGTWNRIASGRAMSIASGYPDILVAVNKSLDCYRLDGKDWVELPNPLRMGRLAVVDAKTMYGTVEREGVFYLHKFENNAWAPVLDAKGVPVEGIKETSTSASGALLVMTIKGEILQKGSLSLPLTAVEEREEARHKEFMARKEAEKTAQATKDAVAAKDAPQGQESKKVDLDDSAIPGFKSVDGLAVRVAVGGGRKGVKGKSIIYMIDKAAQALFTRKHEKGSHVWTWQPVSIKVGDLAPVKFVDIAVASDGTVGALAESGELFVSADGKTWQNYGMPTVDDARIVCERVAIANKQLIAMLDKQSGKVFRYKKAKKAEGAWSLFLEGDIVALAAGAPNILIAIDKTGASKEFKDSNWVSFANPFRIERMAILSRDLMYGTLEKDGKRLLHKYDKGQWLPVADKDGKPVSGIRQVAANAAGRVLILTAKGEMLRNSGKGDSKKKHVKSKKEKKKALAEKKLKHARKMGPKKKSAAKKNNQQKQNQLKKKQENKAKKQAKKAKKLARKEAKKAALSSSSSSGSSQASNE